LAGVVGVLGVAAGVAGVFCGGVAGVGALHARGTSTAEPLGVGIDRREREGDARDQRGNQPGPGHLFVSLKVSEA
jgi:hypothetical protein